MYKIFKSATEIIYIESQDATLLSARVSELEAGGFTETTIDDWDNGKVLLEEKRKL